MEQIKIHWKEILIVIFVLFGMTKCTQSCNRQTEIDNLNDTYQRSVIEKDSIINELQDSCNAMATELRVYEERVNGMKQTIDVQEEASKRISEAKKNINVKVSKN